MEKFHPHVYASLQSVQPQLLLQETCLDKPCLQRARCTEVFKNSSVSFGRKKLISLEIKNINSYDVI